MRIVSLLASGTELCCALGAGDQLVGRSHECDYPEWVKELPVVSEPTFDVSGPSGEIDRLVRARLRAGQPLFRVDEERIARLAPDVLITQTHCEVCAVSPGDLAHGGAGVAPALRRQQVVALSAGTLAGILDGFRGVAAVLDRREAAARLIAGVEDKLAAVTARVATLRRPSVVCLEWIDPIFCMGNWGPELVARAGGEDLLGVGGAHSTTGAWAAVRRADPEVLVVAPCGFPLDRTAREMATLEAQPGWRALRAVRQGRVYLADGNLYFNRSGPSVFDSAQILAEILHPETVDAQFEGR
ncbi:MAG TPA: ABC transporter substrate-binding protein, partial [Polyangia bacterium]|nr:ABC transporter substrate-binding protein [Polyangia bacterium]